MADATVGVKQAADADRDIDNTTDGLVYRQRVSFRGEFGTWAYSAGDSGTVNVPADALLLSVMAHTTVGGTVSIDGGDDIPVPVNNGFFFVPGADVIAPEIVFTSTDSFFVEWLEP